MITPTESRERTSRGVRTTVRHVPWTSILLWLVLLAPTHAAVTEAWVARYSNVLSNANGVSSKIVRDPAGDSIVAGYANDGVTGQDTLTIKYSGADGSVLWQRRYNGPANGNDFLQALAVDRQGNVVVAGYSFAGWDPNGNLFPIYDYYLAKYASADGALLWEKRYYDPNEGSEVTALFVDGNADVVVIGSRHTAKYAAADGALLWTRSHTGTSVAVAMDAGGNVVVTGWETGPSWGRGCYTAKYAAADGALLWEKRSPATAVGVAVDGSGNVVLTGTYPVDGGRNDFYTAKYAAADGTALWEKRHHDRVDSAYNATAAALDRNGNVAVTGPGRTVKFAAADGSVLWERPTPFNVLAIAVDGSGNVIVTGSNSTAKYAALDGALLWESSESASALALDADGNVVLTGNESTARLAAADGAVLWRISTPLQDAAVAVDGRGDLIVTGTSGYTNNAFNYHTAGYASATGALLWQKVYNGPANGYDFARAARPLALGPNGIIAVTGYSGAFADPLALFGSTSAYDFATVVYRELPYSSIQPVSSGLRLRFFGEPGRVHQAWRSPSVTQRGSLVHEQAMPAAGSFDFADTPGPADAAFYHLEIVP
jgi:hypothetical protein